MNYNKIEQDNKIRIWAIYYKNGKNQEDINKKKNPIMSAVRNSIFTKELPLALQALRYGDREFFRENSSLR
ncbi:MAG TPA: staygreen family protein [Ruminiclostridium sp.]